MPCKLKRQKLTKTLLKHVKKETKNLLNPSDPDERFLTSGSIDCDLSLAPSNDS